MRTWPALVIRTWREYVPSLSVTVTAELAVPFGSTLTGLVDGTKLASLKSELGPNRSILSDVPGVRTELTVIDLLSNDNASTTGACCRAAIDWESMSVAASTLAARFTRACVICRVTDGVSAPTTTTTINSTITASMVVKPER